MKKHIFIIVLLVVCLGLNAQQPIFFQNRLENMSYRMEHPTVPSSLMRSTRSEADYTQKLDSVVGSDNFGWTRWKDIYDYRGDTIVEFSYQWEDTEWVTIGMVEYSTNQEISYRWVEEAWEPYIRITYEYDESDKLVLNMYYNGLDTLGEWQAVSKNEYIYGEDGLLDTCLYSTIRNGNWRESERLIYTYNELQQCVGLLGQMKGGWGPFGNNWMDSYRYEFEYQDGTLVAELCYGSGGGGGWWFGGGELELDNKSEYAFDANGNMVMKTGSVYNEMDWIVRDEYVNRYNNSVEAASVQGLTSVWESMLSTGMGLATGETLPLVNQWLSCSIVSSSYDTEFTLYCSGFSVVGEQQEEESFKAYSCMGALIVECQEPADVTVYDMLGRTVASKCQVSKSEFSLPQGLYIVSNGTSVAKVVVR